MLRAIRNSLVAFGIAGLVAAVMRMRGTAPTPPQEGGWRQLSGPELK